MSFSIRIVDDEGDPRSGVRIMVNFGILHGHLIEHTDDDGWATFDPSGDYSSCELFIDGEAFGDISCEDGETHSFTI